MSGLTRALGKVRCRRTAAHGKLSAIADPPTDAEPTMHAATLFAKTDAGQRVLKDRSVPLAPRQRALFILFDGRRSLGEVLQAAATLGATEDDVAVLVKAGLLDDAGVASAASGLAPPQVPNAPAIALVAKAPAAAETSDSGHTPQQRYQDAYPIATALTASLGLRGFRLNLAVEAAAGLDDLRALGPRIREAVGEKQYARLDQALNT